MSTPLLSIGMIVKDEIRCIERCFKSLEGLRKAIPCEVVVADTGSTDGTREIAEKYADIVFDFEWCSDFAAARNAVLDRCAGKWHLQLDADEWLSDDYEELIDFCRNLKKYKKYHTGALRIRNYHSESLEKAFQDFTAERFIRIDSGFRYFGKVHEFPKEPKGFSGSKETILLEKVFLHHDGYRSDIKKEKEKNKRNMEILQELVKESPNDIRILCECIESTNFTLEYRPYVEKGMELLYQGQGQKRNFAPSMLRYAMTYYSMIQDAEEVEKIWKLAKKEFGDSIYVQLDCAGMLISFYHSINDYERAVEIAPAWHRNQQRYQKDSSASFFQTLGSLLVNATEIYNILFDCYCSLKRWEEAKKILRYIASGKLNEKNLTALSARFISEIEHFVDEIEQFKNIVLSNQSNIRVDDIYEVLFRGLCNAEKWKDAENLLYKIKISELSSNNLSTFINTFIDSASNFSNPVEDLQWVVIEQEEDFHKSDNRISWSQYSRALRAKMEDHFKNEGALSPFIAQLETDIGYSARALLEYDDQKMLSYAEKIEKWENAMSQLYVRIMEEYLLFPAKFYQSDSEVWGNVASILSTLPDITSVFLSYTQSVPAITTEQLSWYSNIAAVLLAKGQWDTDEQAIQLCKCFAEIGHKLAETMYSPEMLTTENLHLLPSGYRFSWYLKQAMEAIQTNHLAECVPVLRAALKTAPIYNKAVHVLLDYVSAHNASPELLALADRVRGILSQYSPDDPAIQLIKQSPAYQKVASLIDGVNPPVTGSQLQ